MLSENQVRRLLKQAENVWENHKSESARGWLQALKLVLEEDTYPIRKDPVNEQ